MGKKQNGTPVLYSTRDIIIVAVLVLFWLIPITYVGAMKKDIRSFPTWLRHQQRIACLFTNSVSTWRTYHVEARFGDAGWTEYIPPSFEMQVFGYRSRLHRLLAHSFRKQRGERRIHDVSFYIKDEYDRENPLGAPLRELRFVRVAHKSDELCKEQGRFERPLLKDIPRKQRRDVFGEINFQTARRDIYPRPKPTSRRQRKRLPTSRPSKPFPSSRPVSLPGPQRKRGG